MFGLDNSTLLIIGGVVLLVVLIILFVMSLLKPGKKDDVEPQVAKKPVEQQIAVVEKEPAPVIKEAAPAVKAAPIKKTAAKQNEEDGDDDPSKDVVSKDKPARYHVSQNKDEKSPYFKKWRVRKEGSTKTIKYFDTQKEAIEYATDLADKAKTTIVIHKLNGSIRKQDYTKK